MKRYISAQDREFYTFMLEIIQALGGTDMHYKWLISDIEAYPERSGKDMELIEDNRFMLITNQESLEILTEDDFQWIWAVFSAIPENVGNEEILGFELSTVDNVDIYKDDIAIIQHPLDEIEIVAVDSSSVFIVAKNNQITDKFKKLFPMSVGDYHRIKNNRKQNPLIY